MCVYSFPQIDTECLLNFDFQKKSSYSKERDMENNVRENKFDKNFTTFFLTPCIYLIMCAFFFWWKLQIPYCAPIIIFLNCMYSNKVASKRNMLEFSNFWMTTYIYFYTFCQIRHQFKYFFTFYSKF